MSASHLLQVRTTDSNDSDTTVQCQLQTYSNLAMTGNTTYILHSLIQSKMTLKAPQNKSEILTS